MELTARQPRHVTLARQLLLERQALPVVEGVRRIVAAQAQQPASPYVALWNRLAGFDPTDWTRRSPLTQWSRRACCGSRCTPSPRTTPRLPCGDAAEPA